MELSDILNKMTPEDRAEYDKCMNEVGYYDRLQYVFKIKLNSLYGALTNLYFRFYDLRMGESTTATGRVILRHQARTVALTLDGTYDVDFPLYTTVKDAMESKYTLQEANEIALMGSKFGGVFQSESVIYGDTDSVVGSTLVDLDGESKPIEEHFAELSMDHNVVKLPNDVELLMLDGAIESPGVADEGWDYVPVNLLYRHKTSKRRYKVTTSSGKHIIVTEDHGLIRIDEDGKLIECTPLQIKVGDKVIEQNV